MPAKPANSSMTRTHDALALRAAMLDKLLYAVGKDPEHATAHDWFHALALAVRDRMVDGWMVSTKATYDADRKRVYYFSLEFLIGRLLADAMRNLGLLEAAREALAVLGVELGEVLEAESDAALGNGGLGRLAACFLESMASEDIAGFGYGIRYEHGLFAQGFADGWQVERPEDWLAFGNPWEFERAEVAYPVQFGGHVREVEGPGGTRLHVWEGGQRVIALAFDTPVVGWQGRCVNTLRLWSARTLNLIDLESFNRGDYMRAVEDQVQAESISRVLYPNDSTPAGQELRLKQEYFFTAASLQDLVRRHLTRHGSLDNLADKAAIQLNDTHPAIAVPELMRLLIDEHGYVWEEAWEITQATIHYTNHTLMPEALERWPVALMERLLPRHMQLIYEINSYVLKGLKKLPDDEDPHLAEVSVIEEGYGRAVRMGNLAFLGSCKVNGVSRLHSDLMRQTVFRTLHRHFPDRITNMTNGVTPRRWLHGCNPPLADLITATIGERWIGDLEQLEKLVPQAGDAAFREHFAKAKRANKASLAALVKDRMGIVLDPDAMFDVQIKRIHEYKRQLLNVLEAVALWAAIRENPAADWQPRVKLFAGKAAASYHRAKLIIKLANDVSKVVNADPVIAGRLKVVFLPNYNVSLAERMIPAADLSEQISTAGMEASGTGNMKFALNGALTVGTLDGANIEMLEHVGDDNMFIFGLTAAEVHKRQQEGLMPRRDIERSPELRRALDLIGSGQFSPEDPGRFRSIIDDLQNYDHFMLTADFAEYWKTQRLIDTAYGDQAGWQRRAVLNTARMGWFSSDRTIRGYAGEVWQALPPG